MDDQRVETWELDESATIMRALLDINANLAEIGEHVIEVRRLLEEDGEEETDENEPQP